MDLLFKKLVLLFFVFCTASSFIHANEKDFILNTLKEKIMPSREAFPKMAWFYEHNIQRFNVFGWSTDSRYWAYSTEGDYGQGAMFLYKNVYYIYDVMNLSSPEVITLSISEDDEDFLSLTEDMIEKKKQQFTIQACSTMLDCNIGNEYGFEVYKSTKIFAPPFGVNTTEWLTEEKFIGWPGLEHNKMVKFDLDNKWYFVSLDIVRYRETITFSSDTRIAVKIIQEGHEEEFLIGQFNTKYDDVSIVYIGISPDKKNIAILLAGYFSGYEGHVTYEYLDIVREIPNN